MPLIGWSITIGEILQIVSILVGGVAFFISTQERLRTIEHDLAGLRDVLIILARQDERIKALESRARDV